MKLGLVCISEQLKSINKEIAFRTMTRKRFNDLTALYDRDYAIQELSDRVLTNIEVTSLVIDHCEKQGFAHYRLTCAGFPLITDPTLDLSFTKLHNHQEIKKQLNLRILLFKLLIGLIQMYLLIEKMMIQMLIQIMDIKNIKKEINYCK